MGEPKSYTRYEIGAMSDEELEASMVLEQNKWDHADAALKSLYREQNQRRDESTRKLREELETAQENLRHGWSPS